MPQKDIAEDLGNCKEVFTMESLTDCFKLAVIVFTGLCITV